MFPGIRRSLGIRIKDDRACFIELVSVLGHVRMRRAGTIPLGPSGLPSLAGLTGDELLDLDRGPDAGNEPTSLPSSGSSDEVILGLSRRAVVLRTLELPAVDDKDLAGLLSFEIERHIPFPLDEAWYGFQRMGEEGGKAKVLVAAVRRTDVERDLARLERVDLRPTAVDVSACAAANALLYRNRTKRGEVVVLITLDATEAEVSVVRDGMLVSSRGVPVREGALDAVRQEVARVLQDGGAGAARVALAGGSEELRLRLSEILGLPVEWWSADAAAADASTYGLALKGLARLPLRLDLLPQERQTKRREPAVVVMLALLAVIGILGTALAVGAAYRERRTLDRLTQRVSEVKARAAEVEALKTEYAGLRHRVRTLEGISQERGRSLFALRELVRLLPPDVVLTEFVLEGSKLQIRGSTVASPSTLIAAFERSTFFENAAFTSPIAAQGPDRQGFQLQAFLRNGEQRSTNSGQPSAPGKRP